MLLALGWVVGWKMYSQDGTVAWGADWLEEVGQPRLEWLVCSHQHDHDVAVAASQHQMGLLQRCQKGVEPVVEVCAHAQELAHGCYCCY